MAAARNQSSYTEIDRWNSGRSLPTRAQQPGIVVLGKTPRKVVVVEQHTTPPGYKPIKYGSWLWGRYGQGRNTRLRPWARRERWAKQIINGLSNIHEAGFVQGDFSLSNIVIDDKDEAQIIDINRRGCPVGWESPEMVPRKGRREKWSNNVRLWHDEAASKGASTGRLYSRIDTLFFPQKMSFQSPCGSTSSAEVGGSELLSHPVSDETIAPGELDHFGRNWIRRWKDGPGRNKDWRSNCYLKPMRKGEWAKYQLSSLGRRSCLKRSKATNHHLANTPSPPQIAVPKDMLRQKSTSWQGHRSYLEPKSSWQAMSEVGLNKKTNFLPKSRARCEPWTTDLIDSLDNEEARRPKDRFSANPEISK